MDITSRYNDKISQYFEQMAPKGEPASLYEPINYLLMLGGKRIRPAMVLMSCELFEKDTDKALPAAYALEVFHNFTLMHDDIMDKATIRRGFPTVHEKYDLNTAILSGDAMLIYSYQILCGYEPAMAHKILKSFNKMAMELCEGQRLDMDFETSNIVSIDGYLKMIAFKTSVLLASAMEVGGIIGGGGESDLKHLYEFGKNIGIAFQIQDDLLDAFGDEKKVGKQPGGDIIQNKKTYLFLKAKELADPGQLEKLLFYYNVEPHDQHTKIKDVKHIFTKHLKFEFKIILRKM
ncbi:MAG: polyprenyl synthetase family protein [Saprospiraceae bacterium]|nr:polyprenyl synthetase family protein [Saprospiraceae bacterium]